MSGQQIHFRVTDHGTLSLCQKLDTGRRRIRPLVKLSGQRLHREHHARECALAGLRKHALHGQPVPVFIHLRLGKYRPHRAAEGRVVQPFHVVTVHNADAGQIRDAQHASQFPAKAVRLLPQSRFFLHIYPPYHEPAPLQRGDKALYPVQTFF